MLILFFLVFNPFETKQLSGQGLNETIAHELVSEFLETNGNVYRSLEGEGAEYYRQLVRTDSTSAVGLTIEAPRSVYERLKEKRISRRIELRMVIKDSVPHVDLLTYTDTLQTKDFRKIYKQSHKSIRGENPLPGAKILKPALIITGSVALVVSLFYLRSQ